MVRLILATIHIITIPPLVYCGYHEVAVFTVFVVSRLLAEYHGGPDSLYPSPTPPPVLSQRDANP